ncbi:50S ribosomal protein L11 methyltransferase [Pyruvatibacter mobilis]|uniref:50S ribosomal protein L11 methyltransferase n=1 Tax=Pyruvatibacter mobilis TaxID=1712261 RepID=UPI003BABF672
MTADPNLWQAVFRVPQADADSATDWLTETHPDVLSVSAFEEIGGDYALTVLFGDEPSRESIDAVLAEALDDVPGYSLEQLRNEDWVKRGLEDLKPVRAGRFHIHGSHDAPAPGGTHSLLIEAGEAFGTGQHPTTTGCLLALDDLLKRGLDGPVFDLGCGTGILSIAYARATRLPVIGGDIDAPSVDFANAAARANGVGPLVDAVEATGFQHNAIREQAPFGLVMANVLAGPLISLAPDMRRFTRGGGPGFGSHVILSGLLRHQSRAVEATYRGQGFCVVQRYPIGEWMTLLLQR